MNITHLVLSGGGMRGVIFVGALRYMYLNNINKNIKHIAGCSIGALIGLMMAFKLTIEEMEEILYICKDDNELCYLSIKKYIRLMTEYGLFNTEILIKHLKNIIKKKYPEMCLLNEYNTMDISETITFSQLSKSFGVNIYISCTNINTCDNEIFSIETTPNICVYKACCASMAIPLLFKPINIGDYYYYDGALTNNFPIKIFANVPKENIIGMILYKENKNIEPIKKINLIYIIKQLMTILNILRVKQVLLKEIQDSKCIDYYNPKNLVLNSAMNITFNRKGMRLHITKTEMDEMIYAGFESMTIYIEERYNKYIEDNNKRTDSILNP
jgi:predicted acylesterase/phospholipase RssA